METAYHIYKNNKGGYSYEEFLCTYDYTSNPLDDHYREFSTREEAEAYGIKRGAFDAYGY